MRQDGKEQDLRTGAEGFPPMGAHRLFLVLGIEARRGKLWDRVQALHIDLYLSTGKSPDFGDS